MNFEKIFLLLAISLASAFLTSCLEKPSENKSVDDYFDMKISTSTFKARLAVEDSEKAKGLMHIKSLDENCGMFFVYTSAQKMSFWMKDTYIPLDLAFFDKDLKLREIKKLYPLNLDSVQSSSSEILYALEMNAGWFEKNKISIGTYLDKKLFENALGARGVK